MPSKGVFLLLYLVPDGVYRLGSSLDFKGESGVCHLLLNRLDERGDVLIARGLRFVELILYKVIGFLWEYLRYRSSSSDLILYKPSLCASGA